MKTTFKKIKSFKPCITGWIQLVTYYKPKSLDQEIEFKEIIESNGIKDALWALKTVEDKKSIILFCADVVESVLHLYEKAYPNGERIREGIEACRQFANNKITREELEIKRKVAAAAAETANATAYATYAAKAAKAADAAADADAYYTAYYATAATYYAAGNSCVIAKQQKWDEITDIFLKYF